MAPEERNPRITFSRLSGGLQVILILILIGSCSGASDNAVTRSDNVEVEVRSLQQDVQQLEATVNRLRRQIARGTRRSP